MNTHYHFTLTKQQQSNIQVFLHNLPDEYQQKPEWKILDGVTSPAAQSEPCEAEQFKEDTLKTLAILRSTPRASEMTYKVVVTKDNKPAFATVNGELTTHLSEARIFTDKEQARNVARDYTSGWVEEYEDEQIPEPVA